MSNLADAIDHVVIGTPNLEATRAEFIEWGFQVTPHGVHEKFGTENYLVILEDSYIELLGVSGRPAESRASLDTLEPCVAAGGGVPMLALAADDMDAAYRRLLSRGVRATEPAFWSRQADTPDGPRTASFTTMFVDEPLLPGFSVFYCRHHTVDYVRHPAWRVHANGANRLLNIKRYADEDLLAVSHSKQRLEVSQGPGEGLELAFGNHQLIYYSSSTPRSELHLSTDKGTKAARKFEPRSVNGVRLVLHPMEDSPQ